MTNTPETHLPLAPQDREAAQKVRGQLAEMWASDGDLPAVYERILTLAPPAPGVEFEQVSDGEVGGCWCRPVGAPANRAVLYLHGGAYALGTAWEYRRLASQLASRAGANVFVLDYPLAPQAKLPVAHDLAVRACELLGKQGVERLAVAGDSAGGGLALAVVARAFGRPKVPPVVGCVAFSPWTDLTMGGSTVGFADSILNLDALRGCAAQYVGDKELSDPRASPLFGIPAEMPPILIQVGADELLDDSRRYAARCPSVQLEVWQGMHHVFHLNVDELSSARQALDRAGEFLAGHLAP